MGGLLFALYPWDSELIMLVRRDSIQIDEPERPPHHRFRRNSDSAASPHRGNSHSAFGRTRTYGEPRFLDNLPWCVETGAGN